MNLLNRSLIGVFAQDLSKLKSTTTQVQNGKQRSKPPNHERRQEALREQELSARIPGRQCHALGSRATSLQRRECKEEYQG